MYDMTEYEELMFFDLEDLGDDFPKNENVKICPSWQSLNNKPSVAVSGRTRRAMSATAIQTLGESVSPRGSNISLGYNCQCGDENTIHRMATPEYAEAMITLEDIRAELNSCFTCGVSWSQEHVSLDCSECGGYSLKRPCPLCDGRCHTVWKRDVTMSHESGKARWTGECGLSCGPSLEESLVPTLEKLRATS